MSAFWLFLCGTGAFILASAEVIVFFHQHDTLTSFRYVAGNYPTAAFIISILMLLCCMMSCLCVMRWCPRSRREWVIFACIFVIFVICWISISYGWVASVGEHLFLNNTTDTSSHHN